MITAERLREIAETVFDDPDEMSSALNQLAAAVLEMRTKPASAPANKPYVAGARMAGKPIPLNCRQETCSRCHEGVVIFKSKRTGSDYLCDTVMGEYQNIRQMLTAPNWLHKCDGGIGPIGRRR